MIKCIILDKLERLLTKNRLPINPVCRYSEVIAFIAFVVEKQLINYVITSCPLNYGVSITMNDNDVYTVCALIAVISKVCFNPLK